MQDALSKPLPTTARLSLGRSEPTVSTRDHLRFQLDHALARDAVHTPLDLSLIQSGLKARGLTPILLRSAVSAAANGQDARRTYLRRPDLGRTLHPDSVLALQQLSRDFSSRPEAQSAAVERPTSGTTTNLGAPGPVSRTRDADTSPCSVLILLADGLSALALERHALPLLDAVLPLIPNPYPLIPLAQHARVAIADPIGHILGAQLTVLLIGERPGLSSPDSLGCYITWDPRPGRTDAERNCISNIRGAEGLSYAEAAHRIAHYIQQAQRLHTTGTTLKDPATSTPLL